MTAPPEAYIRLRYINYFEPGTNNSRTMPQTFLTAQWRKLIMANYVVDAAILKPFIPSNTELDLFKDKCFVSLVGFMFQDTRLKGIRIPLHKNFEEINLRFYVHY